MKSPDEVTRAWDFVNSFDVPALDGPRREQWRVLIDSMPADDFQRAVLRARRREDRAHMRPSVGEFRAFALQGAPRSSRGRGCENCGGSGFQVVTPGDFGLPAVLHPCSYCCPDQYQHWAAGGYMPVGLPS